MIAELTNEDQLARLREKLEAIEAGIKDNRAMIEKLGNANGILAMQRSDCLKIIARLTIAKVEEPVA